MPTAPSSFMIEFLVVAALLLPLISFFLCLFISERHAWIASPSANLLMVLCAICASILLIRQWNAPPSNIVAQWFHIGNLKFNAGLLLSNQSAVMLFVVTVVSLLVHLYSAGYMAADRNIRRYFAMLGFFTFSMIGIVLTDSLLVMFVFWELVGFSSYMLIGHYDTEYESGRASKKAFIMNRIGDAGFLVGIMIIWANAGSLNLSEILLDGPSNAWAISASLCIFCGVIGKSAQFPLFTWLPDAMQGPTPVSALIHAATMVAAGVYLLTRMYPLFPEEALTVVSITGAVTAVIGALAALNQFDIKKILAYSTMSQLGLMVMAVGLGLPDAALLHLFTHAFFKACLFLCAGSVIHALDHARLKSGLNFDVQDIRNMGSLSKVLPVTFVGFLFGGASLAGIPFFSGFISKEGMLTAIWTHDKQLSQIMFTVLLLVSFITVLYTFRLIWFAFISPRANYHNLEIHESPKIMQVPIIVLAACSLWITVSWNPFDFSGWAIPAPKHVPSLGITLFSILWIGAALISSWILFKRNSPKSFIPLQQAFYFDTLYKNIFNAGIYPTARITDFVDKKFIDKAIHFTVYARVTFAHVVAWLDKYLIDGTVHLFASSASGVGRLSRSLQSGKIQVYIFWAAFSIIIFLICALN